MIRSDVFRLTEMPLFLLIGWLTACAPAGLEHTPQDGLPEVVDGSLRLELIGSDPEIMTPIGLVFDQHDQLYVLESHTHSPLSDYDGPKFDRIKKGVDADGDGRPESWRIFADGITDGMNLDCGPDNAIYLAAKDRVLAFRDKDEDGIADQTDTLLILRTKADIYDHAGILGVTLSPDGWLFVSRGNIGSMAWEMHGTDGSWISGYGDGGNLVRCRPDGSGLEEVATGFWNPFDIKFTHEGRLLLTDNDPDSRGPNRLVEIVYGGNYGYQSLYGGSGIHPFLAWNGELPGALPYAAALGEAPTGLIDAAFTNFGEAYRANILAGIWEENSIVRIPLQGRESSLSGTPEVLVKGDSTFHPVAFAVNSRGELFFTDWVVRQYPNHKKGRLWRLTSGAPETPAKRVIAETPGAEKGGQFVSRYLKDGDQLALMAALQAGDAFTRSAARKRFGAPVYEPQLKRLLQDEDPDMRLQAVLSLFHSKLKPEGSILQNLLADDHVDIRRMTLIYIAQHSRSDLYENVVQTLYSGLIPPDLFATYLAAIRRLQPDFIEEYTKQSRRLAKQLPLNLPPGFLMSLLQDAELPAGIRAAALPLLEKDDADQAVLINLLQSAEDPVREALLQWYSRRPDAQAATVMLEIARDKEARPMLRTQALLSLSYQNGRYCPEVAALLTEQETGFDQVALRYLCRCSEDAAVQTAVQQLLQNGPEEHTKATREIWELCATGKHPAQRPLTEPEWAAVITGRGDASQGQWVFHSRQAQCQNCHRVNGWGGDFGPDLSHIGSSKSREQLLTAILEPSREISPEWQGWFVTDQKGKTHYGRQIDVGFKNVDLLLESGEFASFEEPQSYGMSATSLMPDGLELQLTAPEVNDLITYLLSLK